VGAGAGGVVNSLYLRARGTSLAAGRVRSRRAQRRRADRAGGAAGQGVALALMRRSRASRRRTISDRAAQGRGVAVTRLAQGVPIGGELDYLETGRWLPPSRAPPAITIPSRQSIEPDRGRGASRISQQPRTELVEARLEFAPP